MYSGENIQLKKISLILLKIAALTFLAGAFLPWYVIKAEDFGGFSDASSIFGIIFSTRTTGDFLSYLLMIDFVLILLAIFTLRLAWTSWAVSKDLEQNWTFGDSLRLLVQLIVYVIIVLFLGTEQFYAHYSFYFAAITSPSGSTGTILFDLVEFPRATLGLGLIIAFLGVILAGVGSVLTLGSRDFSRPFVNWTAPTVGTIFYIVGFFGSIFIWIPWYVLGANPSGIRALSGFGFSLGLLAGTGGGMAVIASSAVLTFLAIAVLICTAKLQNKGKKILDGNRTQFITFDSPWVLFICPAVLFITGLIIFLFGGMLEISVSRTVSGNNFSDSFPFSDLNYLITLIPIFLIILGIIGFVPSVLTRIKPTPSRAQRTVFTPAPTTRFARTPTTKTRTPPISRAAPPIRPATSSQIYCPKCGSPNDRAYSFCESCGNQLPR
ncbi:MAG: zinc ribbon domain-containing protein [Candidatus Heimdallarchaeota archaeon]|nr:MAG: zinc ribbon domain-containing protein [Candidatus Heimdallarchaeota archaeon]